jgi:pimeloyl-ACP methyl ester carboxylesterase
MLFFQSPAIPEVFLRSEDLKIFDDIFRNDLSTPASDDVIESYKFAFRDKRSFTGPLNYYRCALRYPDRPPKQGKLKVPVLSIFGTSDKYLTVESAKNGKLFIEDFEDRYLDGVSHWVQVEAPQKVNKIIDEYLISRGVK